MIEDLLCRAGLLGMALMVAACASTPPPTAPPVASPVPEAPNVFEKLAQADQASNPLAKLLAIQATQAIQAIQTEPESTRSLLLQSVSWAAAEVGDYAGAHRAFDSTGEKYATPNPAPTAPEDHAPVDAVEAIAEAAGTAQVVMINEAHHVPQHRAFTLELLEPLRQQGFTWFAAEALQPDPDLVTRGYPVAETGPYIQEPVFGELIRTALRLGYRIVQYEPEYKRGQTWQDRERGQAANLIERILRDDPQARVLVHLGFSHNNEHKGEKQWMAAHFHDRTGIDPLTINQFRMTERSAPELEEPIYRWATERGLVEKPVVFRKESGEPWSAGDGNDMTVFHPRSRLENGRPTWLRMGGLRSPYPLPDDICGPAPRCLVQARLAREGADAIPVDQIVVEAGKPFPALLLPKGEMEIRVEDADGTLIQERAVPAR